MKAMKWTEQQERAISAAGSDILVSAAAGSGKTAVLTERIKRLIINEGISVDNMLIVTFSNAAAAEMKEKIIKALKKALSDEAANGSPEDAARLRAQIRRARVADISTFHKFSMGIIRRYFYLTDTDQNFGICDESRRAVMIEEALDELMEARFEDADGAWERDGAAAAGGGLSGGAGGAAVQAGYGTAGPSEGSDSAAEPGAGAPGGAEELQLNFLDILGISAGNQNENIYKEKNINQNKALRSADEAVSEKAPEMSERPAVSLTFTEFLRMYADVRSEENVRLMIQEVYRFIMSMPDPFGWLADAVDAIKNDVTEFEASPVYAAMRGETVKALKRAAAIYESVCDIIADMPSITPKAQLDMDGLSAMLDAAENGSDAELKTALAMKFQTFRASKDDKESYAEVKDLVSSKRDAVKKIIKELNNEQYSVSLEDAVERVRDTYEAARYLEDLVRDFHERFTEKKRERNMLDFNDIEHVALEILGNKEIADEYRKHFDVIFVDEYQDSSIIQETLIQRISRGDNVYMVGDVKQSIYKFRLAEPEIFIDKYNDFRDGARPGMRIDLNRNFRSKGNVIKSVNAVFRNIMDRDTGGIDYDEDAELHMGGDYEGPLDRRTSLHLIDTSKPDNDVYDNTDDGTNNGNIIAPPGGEAAGALGINATALENNGKNANNEDGSEIDAEILEMQKTELEARVVAEIAASRVGTEIYDNKAGCVRKVGLSDIVILLRGVKGQSDVYASALKEVGLPAYVEAGEGYFETVEIEVFMNLLRVIDNRRSDIPLLSVLYSPIFGFSTDELIEIRLFDRTVAYNEAFMRLAAVAEAHENDVLSGEPGGAPGSAAEQDEADGSGSATFGYTDMTPEMQRVADRCREACIKLDRWREWARFMPLETFLWKLMQETYYLDYVTALPGGDRRAANLRSLVDKAVDFSSSQTKGLFAFLRYVEAMNEGSINVQIGQSLQADTGEQMIRIMTIHKSKGLEFPIVILAGLGRRFNRDRNTSRVIMHKDLGLGLQYSDPDRHCVSRTVTQRVIARQKERERVAEEMRILYVAMTRPMDELIMTGAMKDLDEQLEKYYTGARGGADDAACYLDWIVPYYKEGDMELVKHSRQTLSAAMTEESASASALLQEMKDGFPSFKDTEHLAPMLAERFAYKYPYAEDVESKSKFAVSELNRILRGDAPVSEGVLGNVQVGTDEQMYPDLLQLEMLQKAAPLYDAAAEDKAAYSAGDGGSGNESIGAGISAASSDGNFEEDYAVPRFMKGETAITAAARGTLTHKVLELIPFDKKLSASQVREFVAGLPEKGFMTQQEAEAVDCRKVAAFLASDTGSRLRGAQWIRREWPFTLRKDRAEIAAMAASDEIKEEMMGSLAENILIQGIIDCCFRDEKGIVVVDYKTDWVNRKNKEAELARLKEEYRRQLELYSEVIERSLGEKPESVILFLLDSGDAVKIQ